jgi:acyl carrier protein
VNDEIIGRRQAHRILAAARVTEIIATQLEADETEVIPTARFVEDLDANPFDMAELFMAFEEAFLIEVPYETAERLRTVSQAVNFIARHAPLSSLVPVESWTGQIQRPSSRDYD